MLKFIKIRFILFILAVNAAGICNADPADFVTITPNIDFGTVTSGSNVQPEVTIVNISNEALLVGAIGDKNPVAEPFKLFESSCANSIIQPGGKCSFMVLFSPESAEFFTDSFNIEIVSLSYSHEVALQGIGGPLIDEPDILVSFSSVDFGVVDVLDSDLSEPYAFRQVVQNDGRLELYITSIDTSGINASEVTTSGNCIDLSPLSTGQNCFFLVEFKPLTTGEKYSEISIITNDPDENPFIIPIRGNAAGEDDGVPAVVEDAGPNNGDGDFDGILDSKQSNVVTLIDFYGNYVTYVTDTAFRFNNMTVLQQTEVPAEFEIGSGIFDFTIESLNAGQSIEVGVILPAGMIPVSYYIYGPTVESSVDHWFDFSFNGVTGAYIIGDASFEDESGRSNTRSVVKMIVTDGGHGDTDLAVNGVITMTSAMPINQSDSSGSINLLSIVFIYLIVLLSRRLNSSL